MSTPTKSAKPQRQSLDELTHLTIGVTRCSFSQKQKAIPRGDGLFALSTELLTPRESQRRHWQN
jgi:hypothetical protein